MTGTTTDIWQAFHDRLRTFIRRRVRNEHDTEDLLQDVFGKIHAGLGGVESPGKLEAWIFQVARRTIIDHFREPGRKRRRHAMPEEIAGKIPGPNAAAELASCLTPMLEGLPQQDQEALRLTDMEGMGQKDLAAKLGLSVTGAKSRVQRARKRLKDVLLDCCRIETDRRGNAIGYTPRRQSCSCD